MKNLLKFFLMTTFMFNLSGLNHDKAQAQSTDQVWNNISEGTFDVKGERQITPLKYNTVMSNTVQLRTILRNAPFELSDQARIAPMIIELPMPDGKLSKFYVTEYSMMEPNLAMQFPDMRTYNIKGIDDPYASGKLDITMHGFHAMVLTVMGDYFIDPYSSDEKEVYISYYKSDLVRNPANLFECFVTEQSNVLDNNGNNNNVMTGQQLRTYRLACAADGEYTAFFGGTVAAGQAAIVTAINRVNGVYERDMSVRMVLVGNNTNIVFTNAATDPYTNNNGSTMLGQNQSTCDNASFIGSANYDIGHVFSTGGGGVAGLGVVCLSGNKARGVTGLPSPVGDAFYIDYVAHEMGHQFGGNHTFNSTTSNCGGGNRNGSTAWEPGSGSTVMPYAGICGADDLQPHSDDYFHSGSVSEITAYTQTGGGNSCAVITSTGNTPPTVTMPSGGFTIPISTPFSLTGSATDAENPSGITYCWEEFDVGPAGTVNAPSGNAPIFRSFSPVTSPTRTFPKQSDLLNNVHTNGELLPTYARNLSFRLTARDNNAGGGGISFGSVSFAVNASAGPFLVTSPNTAVSWTTSSQTVTWNVANTTASPVSCANVNIKLSTDGGVTFPITLLSNTPNDGSQSVIVPALTTSAARVKVESVGNIFFDISNANFSIAVSNSNPVITHTAITDQPNTSWPVPVNASVTSGVGLDSVWVVWYKNSVSNTKEFKLDFVSGNDYSALFNSLNSDVTGGDSIFYKIFAQNSDASHIKDSTAQFKFAIIAGPVPVTVSLIEQGFYDPDLDQLNISDTVRLFFRNIVSPYAVVDSTRMVIDSLTFTGTALFNVAPTGTYYLVVKHRNALDTWSKSGGESYIRGSAFSYDFTSAANMAFGSNMIRVSASPLRFGIYSGDVNHNGNIDLFDVIQESNAANNFANGYIYQDVTGDNIVDLDDIVIVYNNSNNFISRMTP